MVWMEATVHLSLARGQRAQTCPHDTTSHWALEILFNNLFLFLSDVNSITFLLTIRLVEKHQKRQNIDAQYI